MLNHPYRDLASTMRKLGGDHIGNNSIRLWRCHLCEGAFIAPDVVSFESFRVGMIQITTELGESLSKEEEWAYAAYVVGTNPCRCGYHTKWWQEVSVDYLGFPRWLLEEDELDDESEEDEEDGY
jgi:hypothetical protein